MDYGHDSGGKAAGWFTDLETKVIDGKTCLFGKVKLTPSGQKVVDDKEYRYISADFTENYFSNENKNEYGPVLYGAALTNRPFVKDMTPIMQLSEVIKNEPQGVINMNELETLKQENGELKAKLATHEAERKILSDAKLTPEKVVEEIKAKDEQIKKLSEESESNKKAQELAKKETEFAKLLTEGKAIPAQKDAFIAGDLAKFAELASNVKLNTVPQGTNEDPKNEPDAKSEQDAREQISVLAEKKLDELKLSGKERSSKYTEVMKQVRNENPKLSKIAFGK